VDNEKHIVLTNIRWGNRFLKLWLPRGYYFDGLLWEVYAILQNIVSFWL